MNICIDDIRIFISQRLNNDEYKTSDFRTKKQAVEDVLIEYTFNMLKEKDVFIPSKSNNNLIELLSILCSKLSMKNQKIIFDEYTKCILDMASFIQKVELKKDVLEAEHLSFAKKREILDSIKNRRIEWNKSSNMRNSYEKYFDKNGTWYSITTSRNTNPAVTAIATFVIFKHEFWYKKTKTGITKQLKHNKS